MKFCGLDLGKVDWMEKSCLRLKLLLLLLLLLLLFSDEIDKLKRKVLQAKQAKEAAEHERDTEVTGKLCQEAIQVQLLFIAVFLATVRETATNCGRHDRTT